MFRLFFTCVALLLAGLFYYPENDVLQKFDIVVSLLCNFLLFSYTLIFLWAVHKEEAKAQLRERYKRKTFLTKFYDNLISLVFFIFLILNGFSYCTVIFFTAAILAFSLESYAMEEK